MMRNFRDSVVVNNLGIMESNNGGVVIPFSGTSSKNNNCQPMKKNKKKRNKQFLASCSSLLLQLVLIFVVFPSMAVENSNKEGFFALIVRAEPMIRPYIPFRTSPFDHEKSQMANKVTQWDDLIGSVNQKRKSGRFARTYLHDNYVRRPGRKNIYDQDQELCSYSFTLGVSRRSHHNHHHHHNNQAAQQQETGTTTTKSSKINGFSIVQSPIIYPIFPSRGPGKQVLHTTLYEHLDLLSPILPFYASSSSSSSSSSLSSSSASLSSSTPGPTMSPVSSPSSPSSSSSMVKGGLVQHQEFPLLFESSTFTHSSPVIHDVNGDGIPDAILTDYDGGIYIIGLYANPEENDGTGGKRYFHRGQAPRIYLRRQWVEARLNETLPQEGKKEEEIPTPRVGDDDIYGGDYEEDFDPYHSYFEWGDDSNHRNDGVLRGVTANVLGQDNEQAKELKERRRKKKLEQEINHQKKLLQQLETPASKKGDYKDDHDDHGDDDDDNMITHRRLMEVDFDDEFQEEDDDDVYEEEEDSDKDGEEKEIEATSHRRLQEVDPDQQQQQQPPEHQQQQQQQQKHTPQEQQQEQQKSKEQEKQEQEQEQQEQEQQEQQQKQQQEQQQQKQQQKQENEQEQEDRQQQPKEEGNQPVETDAEEQQLDEQKETTDSVDGNENKLEGKNLPGPDEDEDRKGDDEEEKQEEEDKDGDDEEEKQEEDDRADGDDEDAWAHHTGDDLMLGDDEYDTKIDDDDDDDDDYIYPIDDDEENGIDDDYYSNRRGYSSRDNFYDDKHYVRINPHILCTPTLAELPKYAYETSKQEPLDEYLFVPVSYYLDEDEYQGLFHYQRFNDEDDHSGDDNEVNRGMYVASAIMVYQLGEDMSKNQRSGSYHRWGRQEHLELSTDYTSPANMTLLGKVPFLHDESQMGAFAMSSPVAVDITGDGSLDVVFGTSMGIVYVLDAKSLNFKNNAGDGNNWPVQMKHPIESRIVVEDVIGNTDLELFVMDIGGNLICLDSKGKGIWYRDLLQEINRDNKKNNNNEMILSGSSGMSLGDVDGDGIMDLVVVLRLRYNDEAVSNEPIYVDTKKRTIVFAMNAATGDNLPNFPIAFVVPTTSTDWIEEENEESSEEEDDDDDDLIHQKLPQPLLVDLHTDQSFLQNYLNRNGNPWKKPPKKGPTGDSGSKPPPPHGGYASGLHIVLPIGEYLYIIEGGSGCIQRTAVGDDVITMIQVDDVHGTNSLDLVVSTVSGNIITFESPNLSVPYHPLNVWNSGESRMGKAVGSNVHAHGYSASQGIFVHDVSRSYRDVFGALVPVTFTIFDNRPNIRNEPDKRVYNVEMRDGTSVRRALYRGTYTTTGTYTERIYIPFGPGYYSISVLLKTSHGLLYEDTFHVGYNINYMAGFGIMLWLPLMISAIAIVLWYSCTGRTTSTPYYYDKDDDNDDDDIVSDYTGRIGADRTRRHSGILGN